MKLFFLTLFLIVSAITVQAQNAMRPLNDLIDKVDPAWKIVHEWILSSKNKVEVLPVDTIYAKETLYKTQVTTHSPMGAIVFMTGGLLIDDGWIRILGSGNSKLKRTLPDWNKGKSFKDFGEIPSFLLIADDAIGGFYILNGGALGKDLGKIYYFSPDNLEYEALEITYSEFLLFCFNNDLEDFYKEHRWNNWRREIARLNGDEVFSFYPFLWTKEGKDINKNSRKVVPVGEQYSLNVAMRKQIGLDK